MQKVVGAYSDKVDKSIILSTNGHFLDFAPTLCHQHMKTPTESIYGASPSNSFGLDGGIGLNKGGDDDGRRIP